MKGSLLLQVRRSQKQATKRVVAAWRPPRAARTRNGTQIKALAQDIEALIQDCIRDRDEDEALLKEALEAAQRSTPDEIDRANAELQKYFALALGIHEEIQKHILAYCKRRRIAIRNAAALERVAQDYRDWKNDLPDLLVLRYAPMRAAIQMRVQAALKNPGAKGAWREFFEKELT